MSRAIIVLCVSAFCACGLSVTGAGDETDAAVGADGGAATTTNDAMANSNDDAASDAPNLITPPPTDSGGADGDSGSLPTPTTCSAFSFTASAQQFIEIPDHAELEVTGPMTFEAWVRPTTVSGTIDVVSHRDDSNNRGWALLIKSSKLEFRFYDMGNQFPCGYGGSILVAANQWSHIAGTYDGTKMRSFVNGALTETISSPPSVDEFSGPLRIGMASYSDSSFVDGLVADVRISQGALYLAPFTPPALPLAVTASTIALYRGSGAANDVASDATNKHPGRLGIAGPGDPREPKVVTCPP